MSKRMTRWLLATVCLTVMIAVSGYAMAGKKKHKMGVDKKASAELKAASQKMSAAWEKGDVNTIKSLMHAESWGVWDRDMGGKPASWSTKETLELAGQMKMMMEKMGATMKFDVTRLECKASGVLGVCVEESTSTMTMPKMPPMSQKHRATSVAMKTADGWKFTHHHGSLAAAAPMPTSFMHFDKKTAKWMDDDDPTVKASPIWMNQNTMAMAAVMKADKGFHQKRHIHPVNVTVVILDGVFEHTSADGKKAKYSAGDVFYQPANDVHETKVIKPGHAFIVTDGRNATVFVDKDGKPMKSAMK